MTFQKPPVLATILMLVGMAVLCTLGTWQLQRLEWKENLIASYDSALQQSAPIDKTMLNDKDFIGGSITGYFIDAPPVEISPRTLDGKIGKHIYVPFSLSNGQAVFINLGWTPMDWNSKTLHLSRNTLTLTGMMKRAPEPGFFTPDNTPPDTWYWPDLLAMAQSRIVVNSINTHIFYPSIKIQNDAYPILIGAQPDWRNNHFQYAMFWFTMALALLVIFTLRFMVVKKAL
jgi:surfeit locus 1 family protein